MATVMGTPSSQWYKLKKGKAPKVKKERKPTDKLADKTTTTRILQGVFGDPAKRNLARMRKIVKIINSLEPKYEAMSDDELKATS
mgnify:CR=1 FL=1